MEHLMQAQLPATLEESFYGGYFHFWSQKEWLSFEEPISVKLSINLLNSTPTTGSIVVSRQTGVPMSSCQFSFPIDNQAWKFLQSGTKIIVCNVNGAQISKFLLDMDTKSEANSFLSRLLHYSSISRQFDQKPKDLTYWMQDSDMGHVNDSSMDETSTTSLNDSFHRHMPSSLSSAPLNHSNTPHSSSFLLTHPLSSSQQAQDTHFSSSYAPIPHTNPSPNHLASHCAEDSILPTHAPAYPDSQEIAPLSSTAVEYDLFKDLSSDCFEGCDSLLGEMREEEMLEKEGEWAGESPFTANGRPFTAELPLLPGGVSVAVSHPFLTGEVQPPLMLEGHHSVPFNPPFDSSLDAHPPHLIPYYTILNDAERQIPLMDEVQQQLWTQED
jgi:hypothetical protein